MHSIPCGSSLCVSMNVDPLLSLASVVSNQCHVLRASWSCACPCLPLDRWLSRTWCPPHRTLLLCTGHSGHSLKCRWDHSPLGICPPSVPELPHWSAHPQVTRRGPGHEKPQDKQINKSSFPRQRCYSGGNVCDNKPDTDGTECKMCMNFKMKLGTPAGSAAASGCTTPPTPQGDMFTVLCP